MCGWTFSVIFQSEKECLPSKNIFCALQCDKWGKVDAADEEEKAGSTARENSLFYHVVPEYVKMVMMRNKKYASCIKNERFSLFTYLKRLKLFVLKKNIRNCWSFFDYQKENGISGSSIIINNSIKTKHARNRTEE